MVRQQRTVGAILKIDLGDGYYSYAQILEQGLVFFDIHTQEELKDLKVLLTTPVLFYLGVYNDVITRGRWLKIGKLPVREELQSVPVQFIQDPIDPTEFRIYDPNTGEMRPASREECKGLECAAVWEAAHVEERLRAHYAGIPNKWPESLKIKDI